MDIKAELLLTDKEIQEAVDNSQVVWLSDEHGTDVDEEATILLERASVAKAQATKVVTGVFERLDKLDFYEGRDPAVVCISRKDFDSLKAKLLDEIGGEK